MHIRLNHNSGEPIYRQIIEQVKYLVASGDLSPGSKLPSIRGLAEKLKVNPRTIVKAYDELKAGQVVVMRQGQGVFVAEPEQFCSETIRREKIADLSRRLLAEAARLGASTVEVLEIFKEESEKIKSGDK